MIRRNDFSSECRFVECTIVTIIAYPLSATDSLVAGRLRTSTPRIMLALTR